jgi:hypothetical protein
LSARLSIKKWVYRWLENCEKEMPDNPKLLEEVLMRRKDYFSQIKHLEERISEHGDHDQHDQETETRNVLFLSLKLIALEREQITRLWNKNRISYTVKTKLILQLDHREKHLTAYI